MQFFQIHRRLNSNVIGLIGCATVLLLILGTIVFLISRIQEQKSDSYKSVDIAVKSFNSAQISPNIILFGSSPLRMSSFLADCQHTYYVTDYKTYCWPQALQNILRAAGLKNILIFNFALDGEMVSDALIINQKLLKDKRVPKCIVYGITPNNFIDNMVSNEEETPIYRRLSTFGESLNNFINSLLDTTKHLSSKKDSVVVQDKLGELTEPRVNPEAWDISISEYRDRYRVFDAIQFQKQRASLISFCKECQHKGIKLLLVDMPLPDEHLRLLPPKSYVEYRRAIVEIAKLPGVSLLDLQCSKGFPKTFFADIARLNEDGAHVLNLIIANKLVESGIKIVDGLASWWLAKAYFAKPKPPDIVILGSSQLGPVLGSDARVYDRIVDPTGSHRSRVLEDDFYELMEKYWQVFIGALPGAMISDQLVISRALFSEKYKPKLVGITFSPRDFIDNCFSSVNSSESFTFFSKYIGSNLLSKSLDVARTDKCKPKQSYNGHNFENRSPLVLGKPFERISPGEIVICSNADYLFMNNTEEYSLRYKNPLSPRLDMQMGYFDSLLKYLAQQHIPVVAFNLPLTADNKKLLSNSFWKYYGDRISEICRKNGADYISVDQVALEFKNEEFVDSIHLNLTGGVRLSRTLAFFLANKLHLKTFKDLITRDKYLH